MGKRDLNCHRNNVIITPGQVFGQWTYWIVGVSHHGCVVSVVEEILGEGWYIGQWALCLCDGRGGIISVGIRGVVPVGLGWDTIWTLG